MQYLNKLEEDYLEHLLITYYRKDKSYNESIINFNLIKEAVDCFITYFEGEDRLNNTNHIAIINKIYVEGCVNRKESLAGLGVSSKSYYRYKKKYLIIFRNYLLRTLNCDSLPISL